MYSSLRRRTFSRPLIWLTFCLLTLAPASVLANVIFELGQNGGYSNNLLSDSSAVVDRYSISSVTARIYPTTRIELDVTGEATFYDRNAGLSNRLARFGASYIPLNPDSRLSIYLSGNFDVRRYRSEYGRFNTNNFEVRAAVGYRVAVATTFRWGARMQGTEYLGSSSGDKVSIETFAGLNTTLPGNHSLDLEFGYGSMDYRFIDPSLRFINFQDPEAALANGRLETLYLSPRISRSLGNSTGMSVVFSYRTFMHSDDGIVYGSSVGLLSPWTSVWSGTSAILNVKSYLIPRMIATAGCGYWNRRHLRTIESDMYPLVISRSRDDDQLRIYAQIVRPFLIGDGNLLQPRIQFEYSNNNSTNELFDYSGFAFSTGISLRF